MYHGKNGDDDNDAMTMMMVMMVITMVIDYNGYCGVGDDDESPSSRKTRDSKQCVSRFC